MGKKFCLRLARGFQKADIQNLRSLDFDGQSANFTVGLTVTGGTSGAKGVIKSQTDAGATGTLVLQDVKGQFVDNEAITDSSTGAAVVNLPDYCPLLTPADQFILQMDATLYTKSEALDSLQHMKEYIQQHSWPMRSL